MPRPPDFLKLISDLKASPAREQDAEWQQDIREAIALLRGNSFPRDGWRVRKLPDGNLEYVPVEA